MSSEPASGIHHVTLITRSVQANVDFYVGFLGLRLVKRTGGFEDGQQLHLFYGDAEGTPGSLVTFLVWEDGATGRVGNGQVSEIAFAVPHHAIGEWMTRALHHGVRVEGPRREFGEPVFPGLRSVDRIANGPADAPWHTVINGEAIGIAALSSLTASFRGEQGLDQAVRGKSRAASFFNEVAPVVCGSRRTGRES